MAHLGASLNYWCRVIQLMAMGLHEAFYILFFQFLGWLVGVFLHSLYYSKTNINLWLDLIFKVFSSLNDSKNLPLISAVLLLQKGLNILLKHLQIYQKHFFNEQHLPYIRNVSDLSVRGWGKANELLSFHW